MGASRTFRPDLSPLDRSLIKKSGFPDPCAPNIDASDLPLGSKKTNSPICKPSLSTIVISSPLFIAIPRLPAPGIIYLSTPCGNNGRPGNLFEPEIVGFSIMSNKPIIFHPYQDLLL